MEHNTPARITTGERIHIMDAYYFATTHIIRNGDGAEHEAQTLCGFEPSALMLKSSRACYAATKFDVYYGFGESTPIKYLVTCIHCRATYITDMEASLPNLTERINAVVARANTALDALVAPAPFPEVMGCIEAQAMLATTAINSMAREARERIHNAEYVVWMVWFARMRFEARATLSATGSSAEWHRLTDLQYNGNPPF